MLFDRLAAPMTLMVTGVSTLIHLYAVGYMEEDEDYARFFSLLNLFVFAMLTITLADNLLLLFLGWEGVGFCSYALIGFWYREEENAAGRTQGLSRHPGGRRLSRASPSSGASASSAPSPSMPSTPAPPPCPRGR